MSLVSIKEKEEEAQLVERAVDFEICRGILVLPSALRLLRKVFQFHEHWFLCL